MPLEEPRWWYADPPTLIARALAPAASIWAHAAERRYRRAKPYTPTIPVVCVGNFTTGGTGKTPLALHLADELERLDVRPAFLSRGYGGRMSGPHWVDPTHDSARDIGDEPLLLARKAPTLVARDRPTGARAITNAAAGYGAIIMDDGLQNGSLAKSLAIAVVDRRRGIGNGLVMPAGPLRAALAFQLALVDAVVVNHPEGSDPTEAGIVSWLREHFAGPVMSGTTSPAGDTTWLRGAQIAAYCAIGAPDRFFGLLERLGAHLVVRRAFPDHHRLREGEARDLLETARARHAILVTTEKDHVRLATTGTGAEPALRLASRTLAIRLTLEPRDRVRLAGLLEASIVARGR